MPIGPGPPMGGDNPIDAMAPPYVGDDQEIFRPDAYSQFLPPEAQLPPPEPVIEYRPAEPPEPSKEFQKKAYEYITEFCKASAEFMKPHIVRAERNWNWYRGKLTIRDLEADKTNEKRIDPSQSRMDKSTLDEDDHRRSDFLYPINQIVNSIVSFMNLSIFSGPDYLTLTNEDDEGVHSAEDLQRKNEVIKRLLLKRLRQGRYKSNQRPLMTDGAVTGNSISVTFYYKHNVLKWRELVIDGEPTGQVEEYEETVYECPITQGIKLTRFLPDHRATTTDVNRWRGVGHIIKKTYDEALQDFNSGYYHLNKSEFIERFKNVGSTDETDSVLNKDPETTTNEKEGTVSEVMFVEWQGRVPDNKRGMVEVVAVIAYDRAKNYDNISFKDGLLVRLSQETISESGLRTINVWHWKPGVGPIGMGVPDADVDFFYQASQFMGQIHDAAKYTCTGAWIRDTNDHTLEADLADDGEIYSGRILKAENPTASLQALPHPDTFDFANISNLAQQFVGLIERSIGVEEPSQNNASDMKATVYNGLQQRSQAPGTVLTQSYAEEIITPSANLSLSFLVSNTFNEETVLAPDADTGQDVPVQVTRDDLRRGKWVVEATLTNMDNSQMAAAQIIKDLILQAQPINQEMAQEGKTFSVAEALNIILTQTKAPNTNRLVRTFSTREQVLMDQLQQMQQQIMQMDQALQSAQKTGQPPGKPSQDKQPPPGANGGSLPQGFGMGGGPMGEEPTDDNMEMLLTQLDAANRQGVPM